MKKELMKWVQALVTPFKILPLMADFALPHWRGITLYFLFLYLMLKLEWYLIHAN